MAAFSIVGTLLVYVIGLLILYLLIQAAVRNAIDNSETGKIIRAKLKEKTNTSDTGSLADDDQK